MEIKILGTGCAKCTKLYENANAAVVAAGVRADVSKVSDITEIMRYGVMMTPALVIDGEVKISGKVPSADDIQGWLE